MQTTCLSLDMSHGTAGIRYYFSWVPGLLLRWAFPDAAGDPASFGTCLAAMCRGRNRSSLQEGTESLHVL